MFGSPYEKDYSNFGVCIGAPLFMDTIMLHLGVSGFRVEQSRGSRAR